MSELIARIFLENDTQNIAWLGSQFSMSVKIFDETTKTVEDGKSWFEITSDYDYSKVTVNYFGNPSYCEFDIIRVVTPNPEKIKSLNVGMVYEKDNPPSLMLIHY